MARTVSGAVARPVGSAEGTIAFTGSKDSGNMLVMNTCRSSVRIFSSDNVRICLSVGMGSASNTSIGIKRGMSTRTTVAFKTSVTEGFIALEAIFAIDYLRLDFRREYWHCKRSENQYYAS